MTNDFAFGIQSAGGQQTFNPLISILGAFALSCAFLIAAVQVAGKMSADGAGGVMKVGSNIVRGGQRRLKNGAMWTGRQSLRGTGAATAGVTARAGRGVAGRIGYNMVNSDKWQQRAAKSKFGVSRAIFKAADAASTSSFDVRQVAGLGKATGTGTGKKGGFVKNVKDAQKATDEFSKKIAGNVDLGDPETKAKVRAKVSEVIEQNKKEVAKIQKETLAAGELIDDQVNTIEEKAKGEGRELNDGEKATIAELNKQSESMSAVAAEKMAVLPVAFKNANAKEDEAYARLYQQAEGQIKYANELAYRDRLVEREKFFKWVGSLGGIVGGGSYAGGMTYGAGKGLGAIGVGSGAGAGLITSAAGAGALFGQQAALGEATVVNAQIKAIEKRIGKDGTKGVKNQKKKDTMKDLAAAMKEESGEEKDNSSSDKDSSDDKSSS
jgi:hypothetical protein